MIKRNTLKQWLKPTGYCDGSRISTLDSELQINTPLQPISLFVLHYEVDCCMVIPAEYSHTLKHNIIVNGQQQPNKDWQQSFWFAGFLELPWHQRVSKYFFCSSSSTPSTWVYMWHLNSVEFRFAKCQQMLTALTMLTMLTKCWQMLKKCLQEPSTITGG